MVKIKIDTNKDSVQDIKKVIDFLSKFVEENSTKTTTSNEFIAPSASTMDIFGSDEPKQETNNQTDDKPEKVDISDVKVQPY